MQRADCTAAGTGTSHKVRVLLGNGSHQCRALPLVGRLRALKTGVQLLQLGSQVDERLARKGAVALAARVHRTAAPPPCPMRTMAALGSLALTAAAAAAPCCGGRARCLLGLPAAGLFLAIVTARGGHLDGQAAARAGRQLGLRAMLLQVQAPQERVQLLDEEAVQVRVAAVAPDGQVVQRHGDGVPAGLAVSHGMPVRVARAVDLVASEAQRLADSLAAALGGAHAAHEGHGLAIAVHGHQRRKMISQMGALGLRHDMEPAVAGRLALFRLCHGGA
mmetsp:Transcript_83873/g.233602  ORF Transcript_83873/g.233602 Transcript_83873/m.233602 type:complete len:277 (-) Transcript_83873:141-971(-)